MEKAMFENRLRSLTGQRNKTRLQMIETEQALSRMREFEKELGIRILEVRDTLQEIGKVEGAEKKNGKCKSSKK